MARTVLFLFLLAAVLSVGLSYGGPPEPRAWMGWKVKYDKRYSTEEEELAKRETWLRNKRLVDANNRAFDEGRRTFKMELNAFGDEDPDEIRRPLVLNANTPRLGHVKWTSSSSSSTDPSSWDWRKKGVVNPVRNQGQIASALAIDTADAVASYSAIRNMTSPADLSAQEMVDCCQPDPLVDPAVFNCVKTHGGLCLTGSYHSGTRPNICNNGSCKAVASPQHGGKEAPMGDESALADAVRSTPVVVAVDASQPSFQFYVAGVYSDPACSTTELDHALLLVGYGVDSLSGLEYWICRNSWGVNWGEEGYIRIARNHGNMCGIASAAIYPD